MSAAHDEGPRRNGSQSSTQNLDSAKCDTPSRQKRPSTQVVADAYTAVGYRGKPRLYLLVRQCAWCNEPHCHTGKPEFVAGTRKASCGGGRYVVYVISVEADVAA